MGYLEFELQHKALTKGSDVGKGQMELRHLSPPLFLELQFVKLHNHKGVDSQVLEAEATPEMVRGYTPQEREEHGTATWTGGASATGSIAITFGTAFQAAPTVLVTPQSGNDDIIFGIGSVTTTGFTIYWRNETGTTHTEMPFSWLAKGQ